METYVIWDAVPVSDLEAIELVGQQMVNLGLATENYKRAMLEMYARFGSIIVLDEGIAMPHARPEQGAIKDAIVILVLKSQVNFGKAPVKIVVGLCSTGGNEHIQIIQKIATAIENSIVEKVEAEEVATTEQMIAFFNT